MKLNFIRSAALLLGLLILPGTPVQAGFGKLLKDAGNSLGLGLSQGPSENRIVAGLLEALDIGTQNAVQLVSRTDGFYRNPQIAIPLPDTVRKMEKVLTTIGYGAQVDAFKLSMNRAAEQAAPQAKELFGQALKQMTFDDARKILAGRDNEATLYFKDKTSAQLGTRFKPLVHSAMAKVGVTRHYQTLHAKMKSIPFAEVLNLDLDQYVTDRALEGLFVMLAAEERKIRQDPTARVTDLLREVFSAK